MPKAGDKVYVWSNFLGWTQACLVGFYPNAEPGYANFIYLERFVGSYGMCGSELVRPIWEERPMERPNEQQGQS